MSPEPITRLLLFGGASLEGERGPIAGRGAQRRRLALMAILAVSRRALTRDKLIGYLWEESETNKARRLLSESVFVIRKSLGEDALLASGDELRLNPDVVWSDVEAFASALQNGDDERAVTLYRGPLLDGFFINDASEFEQWLDRERDALARDYANALIRLAQRTEQQKDYSAAAEWWRKLCQHDPFGTVPALGYMRALDAAGNRADALKHARLHATRLFQELGAEPDPQVEAFARELRAAPVLAAPARVSEPQPEPERVVAEPAAIDTKPASAHVTETPLLSFRKQRWPRRVTLALVMIAVVATVAVMQMAGPDMRPGSAGKAARMTIAVLPFSAPQSAPELAHDVAHLLSINLDDAGELRSVDPHRLLTRAAAERAPLDPDRARRMALGFNARLFALVDVVTAGAQYKITASLYDTARPDSVRSRAVVQGPQDSLLVMVDHLSRELLTQSGQLPADRLRSVAAMTTTSYAAFKLYLQGDRNFLAGRYAHAADFFEQAIQQDSNFALAYYRLSVAQEWNFDFLEARVSARRARDLSNRLPAQQRRLITPWIALLEGDYELAEDGYQALLVDPEDVEARAGLAEVLVHFNPVRGLSADSALPLFNRVLAELPEFGEARFHALEFAARAQDQLRFDSIAARFSEPNEQSLAWQAVREFSWGTRASQNRVLASIDTASERIAGLAAGRVAAHTHNFSAAARITNRLTRSEGKDWRAAGLIFQAQLALAANDWKTAESRLSAANADEPDWTRQLTALYLLHPFVGASHQRLRQEIDSLKAWNPDARQPSATFFFGVHALVRPELRLYLLGLLSAAAQDTTQAEFYRSQLSQTPRGQVREDDVAALAHSLAQSLRGHIALAKGQDSLALAALTSSSASIRSPLEIVAISPFYSRAHDRFLIATLYERKGEYDQAIRWYRSFLDSFDFVYAAAAHQKLADLYGRISQAEKAAEHRSAFERLTR